VIGRSPFGLAPVVLLALAGCASLRAKPTIPKAAPLTAPAPEALLAAIDDRSAAVHTFRALAQMHYAGESDRIAVKEVVAVERPNRLRIEMMSAFGVALQIASDGERLCAYHRGDRTFYRGRATAANLSRFTRLDLELDDVVDLLIGLPPHREWHGRPSMRFERPEGNWRVETSLRDGGLLTLWFDPDSLLPVRAREATSTGAVRYTASYGQYDTVSGVIMPSSVRFEVPEQQARIDLRYSDVSLNSSLGAGLFSFEAPSGSKIVDLDAVGRTERPPAIALRRAP
jgi:outer membrane lipoprotein-sorting protein